MFYLSTYVRESFHGRDLWRPRGSEQPGWSAIDIRTDIDQAGPCLLWLPEHDPRLTQLADDKSERCAEAARRVLSRRFDLDGKGSFASVLSRALLTQCGVRREHTGELNIWLGPKDEPFYHRDPFDGATILAASGLGGFVAAPKNLKRRDFMKWLTAVGAMVVYLTYGSKVYAVSLTESFNKADSTTLGPDQTWTETSLGGGDVFAVASNAVELRFNVGDDGMAFVATNMASDDHYAQITLGNFNFFGQDLSFGPIIRKNSGTGSGNFACYMVAMIRNALPTNEWRLIRSSTTMSLTTLATDPTDAATGQVPRCEASGSSIKGSINGGSSYSMGPVTDTNISGSSQRRTGIYGYTGPLSNNTLGADNWSAADLGGGGGGGGGPTGILRRRIG